MKINTNIDKEFVKDLKKINNSFNDIAIKEMEIITKLIYIENRRNKLKRILNN